MKIHQFVIASVVVFLLTVGVLTQISYLYERSAILGYLISGIEQSIFRLEEEAKRILQTKGQTYRLQSILDRTSAIDPAIHELSISLDGKTVTYSSQRSQANKPISKHYVPMKQIGSMADNRQEFYESEFRYFDGEKNHRVRLLIDVDYDYVYGQLDRLGWMFGIGLFFFMIITALFVVVGVKRFFLYPLKKIVLMVKTKSQANEHYFIEEFSGLSETIASTFHTMEEQQKRLKELLDESRYLDGILRTVADVNGYLVSSQNVHELSQKCCERLSIHAQYGICWIGIFEDNEMEVIGCTDEPSGLLHRGLKVNLNHLEELFVYGPSVRAYEENRVVSMSYLQEDVPLALWSLLTDENNKGFLIALPLRARTDEKPFGVLTLYGFMPEGFLPKEVKMLEELAGDIGFAIHSYRQRDQLTHHLQIDSVTGLANRMLLIDALTNQTMCGLAILNIDRFGDINNVYGVAIGDEVLSEYGDWLVKKLEKISGVGLFKLGSDEYALLFDENEKTENSISFLEYLIDKTAEESFVIKGIEVVLTITVGFDQKSAKVLENATKALKQAKLEHKSLLIFTPEMGAKKEQEKNIEWYREIKEALADNRIVPYYQPIVDTKTHKIVKYEALIRLIKKDGTVVPPFYFLEIAKKIRLYSSLTKMMIDKIFERFEGLEIKVSINLSNEDIVNAELVNYIEAAIVQRKIGQFIIFEILESEGITNYTEVSMFIERFRCLGCSFAIDDFGAGYSNFDHILKLNIDALKIDASLIKNLPHDHNSQIIVRHICEFAREMGMITIAEFVANEAIYQKVLELGIDLSQGYYFYEPNDSFQH